MVHIQLICSLLLLSRRWLEGVMLNMLLRSCSSSERFVEYHRHLVILIEESIKVLILIEVVRKYEYGGVGVLAHIKQFLVVVSAHRHREVHHFHRLW